MTQDDEEETRTYWRQPRFKTKYWRRRWLNMPKKKRRQLLDEANGGQRILAQVDVNWLVEQRKAELNVKKD